MAGLQRFLVEFPMRINRETILGNREIIYGIREFYYRGVSVHFSHTCFVRLRTRSVLTDSFAGGGRDVVSSRTLR